MKFWAFAISVCALGLFLVPAAADTPGQSSAFGKTLAEWMGLYEHWSISDTGPDVVDKVKFMPPLSGTGEWVEGDDGVWTYYAEGNFDLKVGQKFAYLMFGYYGERYEDGSEDDPADAPFDILESTGINLWIDGKLVISSDDAHFDNAWFDAVYFDPVEYDEPNAWGGVAAIFVLGYGFVHEPLSKGTHTIVEDLYFPWSYGDHNHFTWHVTVN